MLADHGAGIETILGRGVLFNAEKEIGAGAEAASLCWCWSGNRLFCDAEGMEQPCQVVRRCADASFVSTHRACLFTPCAAKRALICLFQAIILVGIGLLFRLAPNSPPAASSIMLVINLGLAPDASADQGVELSGYFDAGSGRGAKMAPLSLLCDAGRLIVYGALAAAPFLYLS